MQMTPETTHSVSAQPTDKKAVGREQKLGPAIVVTNEGDGAVGSIPHEFR